MAVPHVLCAVILLLPVVSATTISLTLDEQLTCAANQSTTEVFQCESVCLPPPSVCNGIPECPDGRDETVQQCGCLDNEFRCSNSCVALVKRCDGHSDCENGEDELDCKSFICPITHFKCNNHFCVPLHAVCDFNDDCGDNSDEIGCPHRPCWHMEFTCHNGKCIRPMSLCDGRNDCLDGSDEADCTPEAFVQCGDGSLVHRYQWCDDHSDCEDNHADEINCRVCDESTEFRCSNGRCVRKANICDSLCDCAPVAGSSFFCEDELNCHKFYTIIEGVTLCTLGESLGCSVPEAVHTSAMERCIRRQFLCDGHNDCYNGDFLSDEFGCDIPNDVHNMSQTFRCRDNRTLPLFLRCDFKYDCLDGDDEENCPSTACGEGEWRCGSGKCINSSAHCDLRLDCMDKTDEIDCGSVVCREGYAKCAGGGQCLALQFWCDFFIDCPDGSDESNCSSRACGPDQFTCDSGQCVDARMRCYDSGNPRDGCADDSHLKHCRDWECQGEDQFKCRGGPCLNHSLLCDRAIDCKGSWNDEDGCPFICSATTPLCECRDVHINCTGRHLAAVPTDTEKEITWFHLGSNRLNETLNNDTFVQFERILYLDLSNNSLRALPPLMFRSQWRLSVLDLHDNLLTSLTNGSFYGLASLKALHLQGNKLQAIQAYAFYGLYSLISLDLHGQRIRSVEPEAFIGLHSLAGLDLSHNQITLLSRGTLRGMPSLLFLNLSENRIKEIEPNVFRSVPLLDKLVTDEFRFCCLARNSSSVCLPPADEFSSCEDLMSNLVLRLCVWLLAGVATVGNVLVIVWRTRYSHCNQVHLFLITNVALGDLIMGTYLLLIALVDWYYRGVYFIHDSAWRSSRLCALAGFLSTFSSELFSGPQVHSFLITNLALGDLIMGTYLLLIALVNWYYRGVYFIHDSAWRSSRLCALAGFLSNFSSELFSGPQVHSFLITNLALGDLIMGTYLLLIALVNWYYRGVYFIHDSAWRSSRLCALAGFLSTFSSELFSGPQVHSFLITNLALGDLIMGTYLLLIALVDWYYRGVYFIHDSAWRSSRLCALAGFLSTFSSELFFRPQVHSFLITNLALGDLIMGTYLLLIALVDWYYRGVYFIHDSAWRSSRLCALAGFLSTFSSELFSGPQVHSFLITNLALGDLIMGTYLLLIALVDWYYRGVYFIHDSAWRSSRLCALAGFLSTFSSELSVFTLTVITLDRFLVIIFPFRVRRLEMARTRRLMALGWLLAAVLSALPLSHIPYFHNFYGRSGVCLALHITPDKPSGWEYSVFVFLFLNLASFSVIAVGYLWMFIAARTTQLAVARDRRSTESAMAWRMTLLVATDAACWVPIIGLGLASLAGFTMPPQVFAWVAVFVLPLNAAVNPVLYTLSTAPFLSQGRRSLFSSWKSRHNNSSNVPTRPYGYADSPKSDNSTCYSLIKRTSVRWHQKVDTAVSEHGEVVTLSHLD